MWITLVSSVIGYDVFTWGRDYLTIDQCKWSKGYHVTISERIPKRNRIHWVIQITWLIYLRNKSFNKIEGNRAICLTSKLGCFYIFWRIEYSQNRVFTDWGTQQQKRFDSLLQIECVNTENINFILVRISSTLDAREVTFRWPQRFLVTLYELLETFKNILLSTLRYPHNWMK